MRTSPLGPSVELPMGPRNARGVCRNGRGDACGHLHWGLRWSSQWGHEAREGCAEIDMRRAEAMRGEGGGKRREEMRGAADSKRGRNSTQEDWGKDQDGRLFKVRASGVAARSPCDGRGRELQSPTHAGGMTTSEVRAGPGLPSPLSAEIGAHGGPLPGLGALDPGAARHSRPPPWGGGRGRVNEVQRVVMPSSFVVVEVKVVVARPCRCCRRGRRRRSGARPFVVQCL